MADATQTRSAYIIPFRSIYVFLAIAFGLAWGIVAVLVLFNDAVTPIFGEVSARHPLFMLAVYAPAIAAFLIVVLHAGLSGLQRFLSRLLLWRCALGWYGLIILGVPLISLTGAYIKGTLFTDPFAFSGLGAALSAIAFMLILGPMEEFGWRGIALPLLQRRMAPIWAGSVLGLIWGIWHLPAFFLGGTPQSAWDFTPFLVGAVAVSVILTPIFNASGGSILIAALFHFALNNPVLPDAQPYDMWLFAALAVLGPVDIHHTPPVSVQNPSGQGIFAPERWPLFNRK